MTLAAKLCLLFNLVVSFLMAIMAFGLWATNLDYDAESKGKSQTPQPPARVTQLQAQIKEVLSTMSAADGTWRAARADLLTREDQRHLDHDWYDQQMALLRGPKDPKDKAAAAPVTAVVYQKTHLPELNPATNQPKMVPAVDRLGQPLLPLSTYNFRLEAAQKENRDILERLEVQIKEDVRLTNILTGTPDPLKKGLTQLKVEERDKRVDVDSEYKSVRPLFINTAVESELIRKRYESMQERIAELKMYLLKKHKVDVARRER